MWGNRFQDEGPSYQNQYSEDENEDVARALELSLEESKANETYMGDMEFPQIDDEVEELAQALEESTLSSTDLSTSTGGRELQWWTLFKEFNPVVHASRSFSFWRKSRKQRKILICDVCEEQIRSAWLRCTFWGQTVCEKHTSDGTPQCCTCSRFKIGDMQYVSLSDGRKLCSDCRYTAVMDPEDCKPLLEEVHRFFKGLNMKIRYYIPILLVDRAEMIRIDQKVSRSIQRGENVEVIKEVEHLPPGRKVKAVLLLYGFPKLAIGATLAHELMHAWMQIEGYRRVSLNIAEGICEVIAHKWLEWKSFTGDDFMTGTNDNAQFLRNLKEFQKHGIEKSHSEVYGHGFREAKWAVERYGLRYTMDHIANTGRLPE